LNKVLTANDIGEDFKKLKDLENSKKEPSSKKPSSNPNPQENIWFTRVHEALKSDFERLKNLPGEYFIKKKVMHRKYSHSSI